MGNKLTNNSFYPAPGSASYVYLSSLSSNKDEKAREVASWAQPLVQNNANSFSADYKMQAAFSNLGGLIATERAAEDSFLSSMLGLSLDEIKSYGIQKLIEAFNKILSYQSSYETYVAKVKSMKDNPKTNGEVSRFYKLLNTDFPQIAKQAVKPFVESDPEGLIKGLYDEQIRATAADLFSQKIRNVYKVKKTRESEDELSQLLRNIQASDPLIQQLMDNYGLSGASISSKMMDYQKRHEGDFKGITPGNVLLSRKGGNAFEIMIQKVLNSITVNKSAISLHTGGLNNMKADHIITFDIPDADQILNSLYEEYPGQKIDGSVRLKNIEMMNKFFEKINQAKGSIVFVSDKNYNLRADSFAEGKGFRAESPSLKNLGGVLSRAGVSNVNDIIFALANTGSNQYNGSADSIEKYLATQIANFLFDDVVITDALDDNMSSSNRIHVFNLGGIYVPLSVFLEGVYHSLSAMQGELSNYVSVQYEASNISYTSQEDKLEQSDWTQLYSSVISSSKVNIHFFGNFIDFVGAYL